MDGHSTVKDSSVVAVQIFDQKKFKRKDQGFLGVINVKVTDVLDLELGGHGTFRIAVLPVERKEADWVWSMLIFRLLLPSPCSVWW